MCGYGVNSSLTSNEDNSGVLKVTNASLPEALLLHFINTLFKYYSSMGFALENKL